MKQFTITSTITIEAESKEEADKILLEEQKDLIESPMSRELLRNAQIDEL